jgi:vitamin B12 transporter
MKIGNLLASFVVAGCTCILSGGAIAQALPSLKETVVSASRAEQPITDVVADISIIDRDQIERSGASTVLGVLARQPGVQVIQRADRARVYLRGADSRMTALYIDGVRVDSQDGLVLGGGAPWEQIPLAQIDRIEVVRAPASAVYGSDAMGGVVQLFTRQGDAGVHPFVSLGFGSFNQKLLTGGLSGGQDGWSYAFAATSDTADGFDNQPTISHATPNLPVAQRSANIRVAREITRGHSLELTALNSQTDSQYVPWGGGANTQVKGSLSTTALRWNSQWTDAWQTNLALSRGVIAQKDTAPNDYFTVTQGLFIDNRIRMGVGVLNAVLEQRKDEFSAQATTWDSAFAGERSQSAVGLGYGGTVGAHAWQVQVRRDKDSIFGNSDSGASSYAYMLSPSWRANVSLGTAFKAPTLEQLFGPYKNSDLQPETSRSAEVGMGFAQGGDAIKLVAYRTEISNMISSDANTFVYYNVGRASIQGATLSGRKRLEPFALHASVDAIEPRDDVSGKVLSLRARQTATLGAELRWLGWDWGAEYQYVGQRFNNKTNTEILSPYELLNLSSSKQLGSDWRLTIRVDNALDAAYAPIKDYVSARSTFYVGLNWQPR